MSILDELKKKIFSPTPRRSVVRMIDPRIPRKVQAHMYFPENNRKNTIARYKKIFLWFFLFAVGICWVILLTPIARVQNIDLRVNTQAHELSFKRSDLSSTELQYVSYDKLFLHTQEEIEKSFFGVSKGTWYIFNPHSLEKNILSSFKDIARVKVTSSFFNVLQIEVTERSAFAIVCNDLTKERCYTVDTDGIPFMSAGMGSSTLPLFEINKSPDPFVKIISDDAWEKTKQVILFLSRQGVSPHRVQFFANNDVIIYQTLQKEIRFNLDTTLYSVTRALHIMYVIVPQQYVGNTNFKNPTTFSLIDLRDPLVLRYKMK
ncbi:MAG: FtsQ-type POTRA domain-containing protein [Alphaproteobacteria bacterium]|nr:FtsQ-type POTRA domain-containing protein [Alphaproteobacteria bacterium]